MGAKLACAVLVSVAVAACGGSDESDARRERSDAGGGDGGADATGGSGSLGGTAGVASFAGGSGVGGSDAGLDAPAKLGPPYPIVLSHGFFGFEEFAGVAFATYFYGVKAELEKNGELFVYTPAVDPFNDSTVRGAQLIERIEAILSQTGHAKVNVIGHSQGGLDARVAASDRPDLVASVTTIATPHQGTPIADVALGLVSDPGAKNIVDFIVKLAAKALYDQAGNETALSKPLELFSTPGIAAFNAKYPNRAGVLYYSVTGRTDFEANTTVCTPDETVPFVQTYDKALDTVDATLSLTETYLDGGLADPYPNDGLVRVKDAKWGTFLGCVPADHLDQIGHLFGDSPGFGNSFKHREFYVKLVAFLRERGL